MNKIPVGATIARAYGFAFGNIVNNLGAIWIPVAILYALTYLVHAQYMSATLNLMTHDPQLMLIGMRFIFVAIIVSFVLLTVQVAALTKEALGLRPGSAFLQFPFGAAAWRLMGACRCCRATRVPHSRLAARSGKFLADVCYLSVVLHPAPDS